MSAAKSTGSTKDLPRFLLNKINIYILQSEQFRRSLLDTRNR